MDVKSKLGVEKYCMSLNKIPQFILCDENERQAPTKFECDRGVTTTTTLY